MLGRSEHMFFALHCSREISRLRSGLKTLVCVKGEEDKGRLSPSNGDWNLKKHKETRQHRRLYRGERATRVTNNTRLWAGTPAALIVGHKVKMIQSQFQTDGGSKDSAMHHDSDEIPKSIFGPR